MGDFTRAVLSVTKSIGLQTYLVRKHAEIHRKPDTFCRRLHVRAIYPEIIREYAAANFDDVRRRMDEQRWCGFNAPIEDTRKNDSGEKKTVR